MPLTGFDVETDCLIQHAIVLVQAEAEGKSLQELQHATNCSYVISILHGHSDIDVERYARYLPYPARGLWVVRWGMSRRDQSVH